MENNYLEHPVIKNILSRKSVRKYSSAEVEDEKLEVLLRCGMAAPSGKNVQPWELVLVKERAMLDARGDGLPYAKKLADAKAAIVMCAVE